MQRLSEQGTDPLEPGGQGHPDLVNEGGGDIESQELSMTPQPPMASLPRAGELERTPRESLGEGVRVSWV